MSETHAETVTFVRDSMLPPVTPPVGERGAVKWLRENLFSTPMNIALTVVGLVVIYWLVASSLPWWLNSVWHASSLGECRQIVAANAGEGATGACWAMIRERWHQFLFGFYPPAEYWRPVLAFGLLFAALAPVLFAGQKRNLTILLGAVLVFLLITLTLASAPVLPFVLAMALVLGMLALAQVQPGKLLWLTLLYPALCFWLLWGGSVWSPIVAMAGFAVLYGVFRLASPLIGLAPAAGAGIIVAVLWWLYAGDTIAGVLHGVLPLGLQSINSDQFGGFLLAIVIGVTGIAFSLPIGILLALGRQSDMLIVKSLSIGFIEFIRGVPLITLLFTASLLLQYFLPPGTNFDIILRVIILVTFFAAAYLAEVIRGGLAALPRGQYEAADALGLDYWRAQRLIILPQALKVSIPAIVSTFIGLFKDTTLVAFVGLMDPLKGVTQIVRADIAWKGIYWEPYIFVGVIFFIICFGMSRYSMYLERKLKTDHR
ncbi:MAG: amino acid ABC transporter permease [Tabrizicola sp.]|jgi:general L-amino acid transport system permease protein|uniref:amino acid ABC transporter permease n=1 Tax=Tabrizicola sp. TaxID=2005166 RepID=UPI001B424B8B|nr:amino acid ABC transporter permease [Tabrizicola sp.]